MEPDHFRRHPPFAGRRRQVVERAGPHSSICDAILTAEPGVITSRSTAGNLAGGIAVSDKANGAGDARRAWPLIKLWSVEPGGCVALAALCHRDEIELTGKCVAVAVGG
ncbi:hypothetical protein ACFSOZ_37230 [Mesorhizobium newzealandense]|uniref:Uncharacterized protein n=1 Tax=Mesorhizobium newzealandense TaxID=1300302 RepID=A0ABW4UKL3_9HYPH